MKLYRSLAPWLKLCGYMFLGCLVNLAALAISFHLCGIG